MKYRNNVTVHYNKEANIRISPLSTNLVSKYLIIDLLAGHPPHFIQSLYSITALAVAHAPEREKKTRETQNIQHCSPHPKTSL